MTDETGTGTATETGSGVSVVVPNWNGRRWLRACLDSLSSQAVPPLEVIVIDNGSHDGSVEYLRHAHPDVTLIALESNTGFAHAANLGIQAASAEFVALVNTDVVLAADWMARLAGVLDARPGVAAVASKMVTPGEPVYVYDAGDVLRRDGACEQRGRFCPDDGRWDAAGEVFGACAGAAMYRRSALLRLGGFDERYFAYLEDVDLALRLRMAGWTCWYEPAVAIHAGEGSSRQLAGGHWYLVERNTLVLLAKGFPVRWLPFVAYRQGAWAWHAWRERRLFWHLRAVAAAVPMLPAALRERRTLRHSSRAPIEVVVPAQPIRGIHALGHRTQRRPNDLSEQGG
jgi:GT2 family glycosyltransferase